MRPLIIVAIAAGVLVLVAIIWTKNWYRGATPHNALMKSSYVSDPNNSTRVSIDGWNRSELDQILKDFSQRYGLSATSFKIEIVDPKTFHISFPRDIEPRLLFFLVNYLQYPNGFDLKAHSIAVVAHVVLTAASGVPDPALIGGHARIYVPSNDTDYDLVYAQIQQGRSFRIPFTDMIWQQTDDARMPSSIEGL